MPPEVDKQGMMVYDADVVRETPSFQKTAQKNKNKTAIPQVLGIHPLLLGGVLISRDLGLSFVIQHERR